MADPLLRFHSKNFAAQLHSKFHVLQEGSPATSLELVAVNEPPAAPGMELFTLHFRGPRTPKLEQKIHHFEHTVLGAFDLFITAIAGDDQGISYEAVFHRIKKQDQS